jgi:hypothetical protein
MLLPLNGIEGVEGVEGASQWIGADGLGKARFAFPAHSCWFGFGPSGLCRISPDGKRWLVPISLPIPQNPLQEGQDSNTGYALFEIPAPPKK